jgi:hypothetical protein
MTTTITHNAFLGCTVSIMLAALGTMASPAIATCETGASGVDHIIDSEVFCTIADNVSVTPDNATGARSAKSIREFLITKTEVFRQAFIYGFRHQESEFLISSGSATFRGVLENDGKFSQIELIDSSIVSDAATQAALEAVKPLVFPSATSGSTTVMFTIDLLVRTINK